MSRIICDICGTAYPDSASCCPICGSIRETEEAVAEMENNVTEQVPVEEAVEMEQAVTESASAEHTAENAPTAGDGRAVTKTKGGHFSKKNVKKRLRASGAAVVRDPDEKSGNRGKKVLAAVLAAAVLVVGFGVGYKFYQGRNNTEETLNTTELSEQGTSLPQDTAVLCTQLDISLEMLELTEIGATVNLGVTPYPGNTTDVVTYVSDNEGVISVDGNGNVTALASGSAIITVTCGNQVRECIVTCTFMEETTESTEETTEATEETTEATEETAEATQEPGGTLTLNKSDVTLRREGESFKLSPTYNGESVALASVTWTSSDESVAVVENGKVTGVGKGKCTITASYNGVEQSCIVRCSFPGESEETTEVTEATTGETTSDSEWSISKEDVTIAVDESFTLKITNAAGETAKASWTVTESGVVAIDGTTVTALKSGTTILSATVDGVTYSCIVRVK